MGSENFGSRRTHRWCQLMLNLERANSGEFYALLPSHQASEFGMPEITHCIRYAKMRRRCTHSSPVVQAVCKYTPTEHPVGSVALSVL